MEFDTHDKPRKASAAGMYHTCLATAGVAAVFSVVLTVILLVNMAQRRIGDVQLEARLDNLKVQIRANPDDKALIEQYRNLDMEFRAGRMYRLGALRHGGWLLLGAVIVMLIALKAAATMNKALPAPGPQQDRRLQQISDARFARKGILVGIAVLALGTSILALLPRVRFGAADEEVPASTWEQMGRHWPCFRGPGAAATSAYDNILTEWDGPSDKGILWKTAVPLPGNSSPVVWGDRVFLSGGKDDRLEVYGFDAATGQLLWTGPVTKSQPKPGRRLDIMEDTGLASPTLVTDGRRVCAIFATGDLACFDFNGRRLWTLALGIPDSVYGYASSLAIYKNLVIVQFDQGMAEDELSKLIAIDIISGLPAWETKRPVPNSWSSPIVTTVAGRDVIITCGDPWVITYDAATGDEIWRAECLSGDVCPLPYYAAGKVYVIEPYTRLIAINADGAGNVTETHIAWAADDFGPDVCGPIAADDWALMLASEGTAACYKAADGSRLWEHEMDKDFLASPSLVGDKLYLLSRRGTMFIVQAGAEFKLLGQSELGENCYASPAFMDGRIYLRGEKNLYCIGNAD